MSETTTTPTLAKSKLGLTKAKKAWGAGLAGAVGALGAVSVSGLFTAHGLDAVAISTAGGSIVGGFLLGYVGAWFPTNAE